MRPRPGRYHGTELFLVSPVWELRKTPLWLRWGAEGETVIHGCAREPDIVELCLFLREMGIETKGAGTNTIRVRRQEGLKDPHYHVCGDRIAAGTYLAAAAATGGEICLTDAPVSYMQATLKALTACGCRLESESNRVWLRAPERLKAIEFLETEVYPGFPTDMQSVFLALLCMADGDSVIRENIFEGRFETAGELRRLGADIEVEGREARIHAGRRLKGASVTARDLRGGAALIVAGLAAQGETVVRHCEHVDRGYERIVEDLSRLGARIKRRSEPVL